MTEVPNKKRFEFLPLTVHLETLGGIATPLVLRGTPLPATRSDVFSTVADDQTTVELKIFMGERPLAALNRHVGSFHLKGIPPAPRGIPQVRVEYAVDRTCAVTVTGSVEGTDITSAQTFDAPLDLTDEAIAEILSEADQARDQDDARLRGIESVNRANSLLNQAEQRLKSAAIPKLSAAVAELGLALQAKNTSAIQDKSDALEALLRPTPADFYSGWMASPQPKKSATPRKKPTTTFPNDVFTDLFGSAFGGAAPSSTSKPAQPRKEKEAVATAPRGRVLGKIFGGGAFTLDPQLCFVLMPFSDDLQPLYDDQIRPTAEAAGLTCERADDVVGPTVITQDIWERINRARFLIAELTDRNANVFYELGLAHALSKDVILLTRTMESVPFDLKALRCLVYEFTPRGADTLQKALKATIEAIMKSS